MSQRIYLSPPHMGSEERRLLCEAFDSNWIAPLGPHVDAFEAELAQVVGARHAVALSSGTAGLELSLRVLGIGIGDRVLVSSLTFAASANAVKHAGAEPVFVDSERTSWNLDPALVEEAIATLAREGTPIKAIVTVDLYGQCADYERLTAIADAHQIPIVEDAAEALGATYRHKHAGGLGKLGVFSFNGNKIITTSGGGMVVGDDEAAIARIRHLATQARMPAPHYEHEDIGYNYRLSNLLAAVGRGQLRVLADRVARRRSINARYREQLRGIEGITFMPEAAWGRSNCWLTCVQISSPQFGASREVVRIALDRENIEARPVWKPMHLQPVYRGYRMFGGAVADELFDRGLCLPSGSSMTDDDVDRVVGVVRRCRTASR